MFRPGRANSLRNMIMWSGRRRELYFFVEARLDGLVSRVEDIGQKVASCVRGEKVYGRRGPKGGRREAGRGAATSDVTREAQAGVTNPPPHSLSVCLVAPLSLFLPMRLTHSVPRYNRVVTSRVDCVPDINVDYVHVRNNTTPTPPRFVQAAFGLFVPIPRSHLRLLVPIPRERRRTRPDPKPR